MAARNIHEAEILIAALEQPMRTLDEVFESGLPALAARIWKTCRWPERMAEGWAIGDHRSLRIAMTPEENTTLYVQFWSEPHEPVVVEVSSGEYAPEALKYVRPRQRQMLEALGFRIGGEAGNFVKHRTVTSSADAEALARETLLILFDAFDYRGQWPLRAEWSQGERARHVGVYDAFTPHDVVKLARAQGFGAALAKATGDPVVLMRKGARRFSAAMEWRVSDRNLYTGMSLRTLIRAPRTVSDGTLAEISARLRHVTVFRGRDRELLLVMPIRFDGGVTAAWVGQSLNHWMLRWRQCERLLRRMRRTEHDADRSLPESRVH